MDYQALYQQKLATAAEAVKSPAFGTLHQNQGYQKNCNQQVDDQQNCSHIFYSLFLIFHKHFWQSP